MLKKIPGTIKCILFKTQNKNGMKKKIMIFLDIFFACLAQSNTVSTSLW